MECEIKRCYRCGRDMSGNRHKLIMNRQSKPYSWRTIGWNRYYCAECAESIMRDIEERDAQ